MEPKALAYTNQHGSGIAIVSDDFDDENGHIFIEVTLNAEEMVALAADLIERAQAEIKEKLAS